MESRTRTLLMRGACLAATCLATTIAAMPAMPAMAADSSDESERLPEVVVTAQKRTQSINDVGLTIQAASGEDLQKMGIQGIEDLPKLVPGLTYTKSIFSTPVFTLRGVGLYDATWGAAPAVAVYTDQVPRNFPVMSDGLDLDIQRVEVLKGPQGTLFGQSATGGAVNYILNKPTKTFEAGAGISLERFDRQTFEGFISGPLSDTVSARFAARGVEGGKWQYSASRPNDEIGGSRKMVGRFMLDWKPNDRLTTETTFTASRDRSDIQAPQYVSSLLNIYSAAALAAANANPATANPYGVVNDAAYNALTLPGPGFNASFAGQQAVTVSRLNNVYAPNPTNNLAVTLANADATAGALAFLSSRDYAPNSRVADWTPGLLGASDNTYFQGSVRLDYKINDTLTVTSLTAYGHQKINYAQDLDASPAKIGDVPLDGSVKAFNQEIHLAGNPGNMNWIVGASYDDSKTVQNNYYDLRDYASNAYNGIPCAATASYTPTACTPGAFGGPFAYINITRNDYSSESKSYAGFANIDYKFTNNLSAHAGIRFTKNKQKATYCYNDPLIDLNQGTNFIFSFVLQNPSSADPNNPSPIIQPGQCFPIGDGNLGTTAGLPTLTPLTPPELDEKNTSFRVGLDYKLDQGTLLYGTISQGYKAGVFSEIGASTTSQYTPATQEKLVDVELGFKAPLLDRRLNVNGAIFYYKYTDKQVRGRVSDPTYGLLEKIVNIPKSRVYGAEADLEAVPVNGLHLRLSATYLKTKVTDSFSKTPDGVPVYNAEGFTGDFKDAELPFAPKFTGSFDAEYEWNVGKYSPFFGATAVHTGSQNATFENAQLPAQDFVLNSYTTLDVRAGLRGADNKWTATVFCHNCASKYYVNSVSFYLDSFERFTGMPAVYGVNVRWNF
jgi:outer membrane receptor protein involved in Fe transport